MAFRFSLAVSFFLTFSKALLLSPYLCSMALQFSSFGAGLTVSIIVDFGGREPGNCYPAISTTHPPASTTRPHQDAVRMDAFCVRLPNEPLQHSVIIVTVVYNTGLHNRPVFRFLF